RSFHTFRAEGHRDCCALAGGLITGVEHFLDEPAVLAGGLRRFLATYTTGEVVHLLRETVVPQLFKHRPGLAFDRGRFLDRITIAVFAVSRQRVAHVQIGIRESALPINLDAIFHATAPGPAVFNYTFCTVIEIQDA